MDNSDNERDAHSQPHSSAPLDLNNIPELPRENLISTAIKFLQNPKVVSSALSQKRAFLKSKGLTEHEIDIAIQRSGATDRPDVGTHAVVGPTAGAYQAPPLPVVVAPVSGWARLREILSSAVLVGGLAYAVYYVYQKYVAPYLFGKRKSKLDALEQCVAELKTNSDAVLQCVRELQEQQQRSAAINPWTSKPYQDDSYSRTVDRQYVEEIKGEIKSLKALLLTPRQFPQAPATKPLLPEWQLTPSSSSSKLSAATAASVTLPPASFSGPPSIGDGTTVAAPLADNDTLLKSEEEKDTGISFAKMGTGSADEAVDLSVLSNGSHDSNGLKSGDDE